MHTSSFAHFPHSATSPSFAYIRLYEYPALDSSCCRAVASQLHLLLPVVSASAASLVIRFNCCSLIASTSTAPPLRPNPLRLLLPGCIRFTCCSLIASACSPSCSGRFHILKHSLGFSKLRHFTSPAPQTSHFRHAQTHVLKC